MNKAPGPHQQRELREKRKELHGRQRELHERLSDVCEDFVAGDLTTEHKRRALVRELRYLLDYYEDEESWKGVE